MGTYIRTLNTPDISEEKLPEFIDRLLVIASQGGMMELHNTALLGRDIILLYFRTGQTRKNMHPVCTG